MNIIRCSPLSAQYRVLNSSRGNYIPVIFIHCPTLRARRTERKKEKGKQTEKTQNELAAHKRAPLLTLGRKNSRWNEKFKRVAARLSSRSGGWQISAIQARYQPARFPAIDNLSAREIRRRRREFITHRRSRGLAKVRLLCEILRRSENESILIVIWTVIKNESIKSLQQLSMDIKW